MDQMVTPQSPSSQPVGEMVRAMQNFFVWSKQITLWFSRWSTETVREYMLTLLAVFFLAVLYQWLTSIRTILVSRFKAMQDSAGKLDELEAGSTITLAQKHPKVAKLVLAVLFGINSALGYLVMLAVMGFNVGVFLAVVLGLTVAYLFCDL